MFLLFNIRHNRHFLLFLILTAFFVVWVLPVQAQDRYQSNRLRDPVGSVDLNGMRGLNTVPNARMDEVGTVRLGSGTSDPYLHGFLGFQITEPLYVNIRQTLEVSGLNSAPKKLYPGLDFKLKLLNETAKRPAIVMGANSAVGHKRTSSEYIAFSKRKNNFDFTGGVAWGRLSGKGHIKNPLGFVLSHFDKTRDFNNENPQGPDNWFTGEEIGFFGGIEYYTPIKNVSLKADFGGQDYAAETTTNAGFNKPSPWGLGINYNPWKQLNISAGLVGFEKVMAQISIQDQIQKWPGRKVSKKELSSLDDIENIKDEDHLRLSPYKSTAHQIGNRAVLLAQHLPVEEEKIEIPLNHMGLKGSKVRLIRRDIDARLKNQGSPEEIWRDVMFVAPDKTPFSPKKFFKGFIGKNFQHRFILDNQISLSEEDAGILYRSAALVDSKVNLPYGLNLGNEMRVNIADNIGLVENFRLPKNKVARSDEADFASNRFSVNRTYASWLHSVSQNTHMNLSAGYLDEMFAGYGGEILHRPFGKTFAVEGEIWHAHKRDADESFALGLTDDDVVTGHVNLFYELPNQTTTLFTKAGRYLGEDWGTTFGVENQFKNGSKVEGFLTTTNKRDRDPFGGQTHLYGGVRLTMPIGNVPLLPSGSEARLTIAPFARDTGQVLDHPNKLYQVTEPIAYRQIHQSWPDLLR